MRQGEAPYIRMDHMTVGYSGKALIRDICIDIRQGEIVTLIGPNGAGKSTILKSLSRQLALIHGKVIYEDRDLHRMPAKDLSQKMAVVLTERLKTDLLTCYDIVASGRYPYTGRLGLLTEEDEAKVDEAMATVGAEDLGTKDFNAISDGQRQRILLARAICQEPEVIILDEPTSFLDIRYKLELLSILRRMAKEKGITVIMSLHEIDLAEKISDRVLCVKGDRIDRYGAPEDIFREEIIRQLYEINNGFFDPLLGSIELPAPGTEHGDGAPRARVLVLSSGGSGIPVYRRLQKENLPFAAGILTEGDIDYQLARLLAADVILTPPFEPITEDAYGRAKAYIEDGARVIWAGCPIGSMNRGLQALLARAKELGTLERVATGRLQEEKTSDEAGGEILG